jgi:hypothetical protein
VVSLVAQTGCTIAEWAAVTPITIKRFWGAHFLSIDYGFGGSSAAAYMHVCLQYGTIVTVAEIVEKHMPVYEFGAEIIRRFDLHGTDQNGERRNVVVVYQGPANKSHIGTGHSVCDQLNEVLA